ncbi:hypothetical protein J4E93_006163 [Alternaria ventricosa]|uniref:uncharacterized protein n=1 Tax=Alternaria ventricosa TaxID=1187951 RepID=UPI0020C4C466|nr:uncharacterized protein J4E93_006163 [Alternaria ventricosa]KAI4644263.1 hypothetical protein J4E93_006163 [Alternaria ventricosa]
MDPLSVTANVITVLQVANSIITICYEVRSALKQSPWSLTRTIDEIRDLRNVLESLEQVCRALDTSKESNAARFRTFQLLCESETSPLSRCLQELLDLEKKINSDKQTPGRSTLLAKARVFAQVMGWQLKEGDAKMTISLNETTAHVHGNVSKLLTRIESAELDDRSRALTHWLAPVTPWESHEAAASARRSGTGGWFIESKVFQAWAVSGNAGLWLSGFRM